MQTARWRFVKQLRLIQATDFQRVFQTGIKYSNRGFAFYVKPNDLPCPRLGLAIAKKVVKLAVKRNQIKRVIRESFRIHQQVLIGLDIVVVFYNRQPWDKATLKHELDKQWIKLTSACKKS